MSRGGLGAGRGPGSRVPRRSPAHLPAAAAAGPCSRTCTPGAADPAGPGLGLTGSSPVSAPRVTGWPPWLSPLPYYCTHRVKQFQADHVCILGAGAARPVSGIRGDGATCDLRPGGSQQTRCACRTLGCQCGEGAPRPQVALCQEQALPFPRRPRPGSPGLPGRVVGAASHLTSPRGARGRVAWPASRRHEAVSSVLQRSPRFCRLSALQPEGAHGAHAARTARQGSETVLPWEGGWRVCGSVSRGPPSASVAVLRGGSRRLARQASSSLGCGALALRCFDRPRAVESRGRASSRASCTDAVRAPLARPWDAGPSRAARHGAPPREARGEAHSPPRAVVALLLGDPALVQAPWALRRESWPATPGPRLWLRVAAASWGGIRGRHVPGHRRLPFPSLPLPAPRSFLPSSRAEWLFPKVPRRVLWDVQR